MNASITELLQQASGLHARGEVAQAAAIYMKIGALDPAQPDAIHLLGVALTQSGEPERGAKLIERSLELNPAQPVAHANLGNARFAMQQFGAALSSYDRCIAQWPEYAAAHNGRGSALAALARHAEALASFDRALQLLPDFPEAMANRGLLLLKLNRCEEAITGFDEALRLRPASVGVLTSRAMALCQLGRFPEALADADRALQCGPAFVQAHHARCIALLGLRRLPEVLAELDLALRRTPDDAQAWFLRGNALRKLGRRADAAADYERALQLRADFPEALFELGTLEVAARRYAQGAEVFERLLSLTPDRDFVRGACLHARLCIFDWSDYARTVERILADMAAGRRPDLPLSFLAVSDAPDRQLQCAHAFAELHARRAVALPSRARTRGERLRIAYISADFLEHPTAYLLAGLFETHDRARFDVTGVCLRSDDSPTAKRLRAAFDRCIDVTGQADHEVAELIHDLGVDIAVDLMGYTDERRSGILARHPAPIQVNYLGVPATMGCKHIDYIVADRFVIPPAAACFYTESVAWLPECFQGNDARRAQGAEVVTRADAGLPDDGFVWCAFHAGFKLNPPLFELWTRLLNAVPNSVLWLVADTPVGQLNLRREAAKRGIDPGRLVFAKREPYPRHLARLGLADVCLDTWPFNGGATTSDALWAGVPVVTRAGRAFASRMSGSMLRTLGLPELVTESFADYERVAAALATDRDALLTVRSRLGHARGTSSLFDTDRFRRHLEAAYTIMFERYRRGEAAASFLVPG